MGLQSLSFLLCLQMFGIAMGKSGWVSDIFASYQKGNFLGIGAGSVSAREADSDKEANESTPAGSIPDQENECSELTDYFCVEPDCLVPDNFISSVRQEVAVLVDASLETRISDITPPPPKPCFV